MPVLSLSPAPCRKLCPHGSPPFPGNPPDGHACRSPPRHQI